MILTLTLILSILRVPAAPAGQSDLPAGGVRRSRPTGWKLNLLQIAGPPFCFCFVPPTTSGTRPRQEGDPGGKGAEGKGRSGSDHGGRAHVLQEGERVQVRVVETGRNGLPLERRE
jgi:hypothetical protein